MGATRTCVRCGTEFPVYPSTKRRYCTRDCFDHRAYDAAMEHKRCGVCGEMKLLEAFHTDITKRFGLAHRCKDCTKKLNHDLYWSDPEKARSKRRQYKSDHRDHINGRRRETYDRVKAKAANRRHALKRLYGLSEADWEALFVAQEGRCAICSREPKTLVVDHDHDTGRVRGLLCTRCNTALGQLIGDDHAQLDRIRVYLKPE